MSEDSSPLSPISESLSDDDHNLTSDLTGRKTPCAPGAAACSPIRTSRYRNGRTSIAGCRRVPAPMAIADHAGNPTDDEVAATVHETPDGLSRNEITQEIDSINGAQKDALVALFWIGRGDAGPGEIKRDKLLNY